MAILRVYDIETLANCFTLTAIPPDADDVEQFVIHHLRDDRVALFKHLKQPGLAQIGFNNLRFDYPVIHWMLEKEWALMSVPADRAAREIYKFVGKLNLVEEKRTEVYWKDVKIKQCDVYRIHHFDNHAKHASLKWVQIGMHWKNVQDMPIHHNEEITHMDQIILVLEYNLNDVLSTRELYIRSRKAIDMRKVLGAKYGLRNLLNANDPKVGQEIILKLIADRRHMKLWDLKQLRTNRTEIDLKECILPGISLSPGGVFQAVKEKFESTILTDLESEDKLKGKFGSKVAYDGMYYIFGLGGLHACRAERIYRSTDEYDILSCDVSSYYPNLSIMNRFFPEHLGEVFCDVYESMYKDRKFYKKGTPENEGLKLSLNGAFGKSNDIHSPLRDPKFTMQITVNGQLLLTELCEELTEAGMQILMANTDGIEVQVPVAKREEYRAICLAWQEKWKLELEHKKYKVLATRDVNNYIGIFENGEIKCKGAYEIDKPLHKDPSMRIVSLAVKEYVVNGTPLSQTIKKHTNIYDFMLAIRAKGDAWFELIKGEHSTKLTKTNRYIVSPTGEYMYKQQRDGGRSRVSAGYPVTLVNRIDDRTVEQLHIDHNYYIMEATKLLLPFLEPQYSLGF